MKGFFSLLLCSFLFLILACDDDGGTPGPDPMPDPEPASLSSGILLHIPFAGNADDISSTARAGTVTGATITIDRHGVANEAYYFDGTDDFIDYGLAPDLGLADFSPYTMAAWVKIEPVDPSHTRMVLSKFHGGVVTAWYFGLNANGNMQVYRNVGPWANFGAAPVPTNEYAHIAATYDGANLITYINGSLDKSVAFTSHPDSNGPNLLVGAATGNNGPVSMFKGTIDDIRVYNRVLTSEELNWLATH